MVIGLQRRLHCLRDSDGSEAPGRSLVLARRGAPHQGCEPTAVAIARHQKLRAESKGILTRLDTVLNQDLGAFSKAVAGAGIPPVILVPSNKPH